MLPLLISDLGSVVFRISHNAFYQFLAERSPTHSTIEELKAFLGTDEMRLSFERLQEGKETSARYWSFLLQKLSIEPNNELIREISVHAYHTILGFDESVLLLFEKLRKEGLRMVALSNMIPETKKRSEEFLGQVSLFERRYYSVDLQTRKPNPSAYYRVMSFEMIEPSHCIVIDDNNNNLRIAQQIGTHAIFFDNTTGLKGQLEQRLYRLLEGFS